MKLYNKLESCSTIGLSEATRKDTMTPCAERRRGDNSTSSARKGHIHIHTKNVQNGSRDCAETHGGN